VRVALLGSDGRAMPLRLESGATVSDGVLHVRKRSETFRFTGIESRPVPSLLQRFSAPVRLTVDLSDRDLEFLVANDPDLFNRWQSANAYAMRTLIQITATLKQGRRSARGGSYAKAIGEAIAGRGLDPAYKAELLKLPSPADVAREIGQDVDPGLIFKAHRQLQRVIVAALGDELEAIYASSAVKGPFSPDAKSAGKRALRNAALTLLSVRGEAADHQRLWDHFRKASSMTDEAHAMVLLAASDTPQRDKALARFYERWQGDHLVIDTWFAAQAMSPLPGTLDRVRDLTRHPLFSHAAPNKVRALIGNFALQNTTQFNRADGAGYTFVAEEVMRIDRLNPQIAARMLGCFRSWRALEPVRRGLARKALQKVAKAQPISRDVFEIVTKMLES
jgi:aminopeptidase N